MRGRPACLTSCCWNPATPRGSCDGNNVAKQAEATALRTVWPPRHLSSVRARVPEPCPAGALHVALRCPRGSGVRPSSLCTCWPCRTASRQALVTHVRRPQPNEASGVGGVPVCRLLRTVSPELGAVPRGPATSCAPAGPAAAAALPAGQGTARSWESGRGVSRRSREGAQRHCRTPPRLRPPLLMHVLSDLVSKSRTSPARKALTGGDAPSWSSSGSFLSLVLESKPRGLTQAPG